MEVDSIAETSRKLEVSRDTVYRYLAIDYPPQKLPPPRGRVGSLDLFYSLIDSWNAEYWRNLHRRKDGRLTHISTASGHNKFAKTTTNNRLLPFPNKATKRRPLHSHWV